MSVRVAMSSGWTASTSSSWARGSPGWPPRERWPRPAAPSLVLEAHERVGGRVLTLPFLDGSVDLGAQWIGPGQERVARLASELGVETAPQLIAGRDVLLLRKHLRPVRGVPGFRCATAPLSLPRGAPGRHGPARPDRRAGTRAEGAGVDRLSVGDWLAERIASDDARALIETAFRLVFTAEPDAVSLLYALRQIHACGGPRRMAAVRDGAQQDRLVGGAGLLANDSPSDSGTASAPAPRSSRFVRTMRT